MSGEGTGSTAAAAPAAAGACSGRRPGHAPLERVDQPPGPKLCLLGGRWWRWRWQWHHQDSALNTLLYRGVQRRAAGLLPEFVYLDEHAEREKRAVDLAKLWGEGEGKAASSGEHAPLPGANRHTHAVHAERVQCIWQRTRSMFCCCMLAQIAERSPGQLSG